MINSLTTFLAAVHEILAAGHAPSLAADLGVAAVPVDKRNVVVTALFEVLTDAAWDAALNEAVDAWYDPWTWTDSGRPTDDDRLWMIVHHWALQHQRAGQTA